MKSLIETFLGNRFLATVILIALAALLIRIMPTADIGTSALLYVAIPCLICIAVSFVDTANHRH